MAHPRFTERAAAPPRPRRALSGGARDQPGDAGSHPVHHQRLCAASAFRRPPGRSQFGAHREPAVPALRRAQDLQRGPRRAMLAIMRNYGHLVPALGESTGDCAGWCPRIAVRLASQALRALLRGGDQGHAGKRPCADGAQSSAFLPNSSATSPGPMSRDFPTSPMFRTSGCSSSATRAARS